MIDVPRRSCSAVLSRGPLLFDDRRDTVNIGIQPLVIDRDRSILVDLQQLQPEGQSEDPGHQGEEEYFCPSRFECASGISLEQGYNGASSSVAICSMILRFFLSGTLRATPCVDAMGHRSHSADLRSAVS